MFITNLLFHKRMLITTMLMIPDSTSNAPSTPDIADPTAALLQLVPTMTGVIEGLQAVLLLLVVITVGVTQVHSSTGGTLVLVLVKYTFPEGILLLPMKIVLRILLAMLILVPVILVLLTVWMPVVSLMYSGIPHAHFTPC